MGRFNRYGAITASAAHESRRELQRTRAEARRQRDLCMMIVATLALANGGELTITKEMTEKIRRSHEVQIVPRDGDQFRVVMVDTDPEVVKEPELEVMVVEDAPAEEEPTA